MADWELINEMADRDRRDAEADADYVEYMIWCESQEMREKCEGKIILS